MSRAGAVRRVIGLVVLFAIVCASPAAAARRDRVSDVIHGKPSAASDRRLARAGETRYPVGDSKGRTIAVSVTPLCASSVLLCNSANPQAIATFLGTLAHGDEISSLVVQITTDQEIAADCGADAQACYFPDASRMLISGNDTTGPDGATREFVLAHEYGHHLANNRSNPPFVPTIDYGPKYWATYEHVCEGTVAGKYFPGDEGAHYRENPGEAFAESFAFNRFPNAPVDWAWTDSLKPDAGAFAAIQRDALDPWSGPTRTTVAGRFGRHGRRSFRKVVGTPLDGTLKVTLSGARRANLNLQLRNAAGQLIANSSHPGSSERVSGTLCGQRKVVVIVKRAGAGAGRFQLKISRP